MGRLRFGEVKWLPQGHTANTRQPWDENPRFVEIKMQCDVFPSLCLSLYFSVGIGRPRRETRELALVVFLRFADFAQ